MWCGARVCPVPGPSILAVTHRPAPAFGRVALRENRPADRAGLVAPRDSAPLGSPAGPEDWRTSRCTANGSRPRSPWAQLTTVPGPFDTVKAGSTCGPQHRTSRSARYQPRTAVGHSGRASMHPDRGAARGERTRRRAPVGRTSRTSVALASLLSYPGPTVGGVPRPALASRRCAVLPDTARELKARLSARLSAGAPSAAASALGGATRVERGRPGSGPGRRPTRCTWPSGWSTRPTPTSCCAAWTDGAREEVDVRVIGRVRSSLRPRPASPADAAAPGAPAAAGPVGRPPRRHGRHPRRLRPPSGRRRAAGAVEQPRAGRRRRRGRRRPGTAARASPTAAPRADRIGQPGRLRPARRRPGNLVDAAVAALDAGWRPTRRRPRRAAAGHRGRRRRRRPRRAGGEGRPHHRAHPRPDHRGRGRRRRRAVRRRGAHLRRPGGDRGADRRLQRRR